MAKYGQKEDRRDMNLMVHVTPVVYSSHDWVRNDGTDLVRDDRTGLAGDDD